MYGAISVIIQHEGQILVSIKLKTLRLLFELHHSLLLYAFTFDTKADI